MSPRLLARSTALTLLAGAVIAAAAPTSAQPTDPATAQLAATIDTILADARLDGAQAAVTVRDTTTGETLYDRNGSRRLIPASNTKLLTSAAAMEMLGSGYRFITDVRTTARQSGSILAGDIYLRGTGDPTLLESDYDAIATELAAKGIRSITGDLVADDTWFDNVRLGPVWSWDDQPYYYSAQISALSVSPDTDYDPGTVIVTVTPAATAGGKPAVTLTPDTGYVTIENRTTTVAAGGAETINMDRPHGTNRIVLTGNIPVGGSPAADWVTVWEPTGYAADVFRRALHRHGIRVFGRNVLGLATPASARTLVTHQSMTLAELLIPFLKLSNNPHSEILIKAIGRKVSNQGTWSAGLAATRPFLASVGMDTATQRQADGSGLSRWNLVPPNEFTDMLAALRAKPWFDTWYAALPIAGNADRLVGGTLRNRMRNTPAANNVHAKTGSLTSVSGLSGYVTDADGRVLVFSILLNNYLASSVKIIEDQIAIALATFTRAPAVGARMVPPKAPQVPEAPRGLECSWVKPNVC